MFCVSVGGLGVERWCEGEIGGATLPSHPLKGFGMSSCT